MSADSRARAATTLTNGVHQLGLDLPADSIETYLRYGDELHKWNRQINLTSITDANQIAIIHVLDCLAALPFAHAKHIACIGSGGGTPGLIWAIARPDFQLTLVEPRQKRAAFLVHTANTLGLNNVKVANHRCEHYIPVQKFDTLTCRALATLSEFVGWSQHLAHNDTHWVALKGRVDKEELAQVQDDFVSVVAHRVDVPFLTAERHIVVMRDAQHINDAT